MTLTSFLDVKADPPKPDETKVDLLKNLSNEAILVNGLEMQSASNPLHTVEYVELYNYRVARRRRLCRVLAWLLAVFLLLDIGVVLYISLRMRHAAETERLADTDTDRSATFTCRLRFRSAEQADRAERITASRRRVLMQPLWATDGSPTVLHDLNRGFTLLRSPFSRMCFIKHAWRRPNWAKGVAAWAKESHDVAPEQTRYIRMVVRRPISLEQLMSYGTTAWSMCSRYTTYLVETVNIPVTAASVEASRAAECPMLKCIPCPSGAYLRDSNGCQTCNCVPTVEGPMARSRRHAVAGKKQRQVLQLDEGVLPDESGRSVHTIDVIEF